MHKNNEDMPDSRSARALGAGGDWPWGRGGRGGFGAPRRGPGRARRGDVQIAILNLLAEQSMHGYQISCSSKHHRKAYGWQRDGGHAPYLLAEEEDCVPLPDALRVRHVRNDEFRVEEKVLELLPGSRAEGQ